MSKLSDSQDKIEVKMETSLLLFLSLSMRSRSSRDPRFHEFSLWKLIGLKAWGFGEACLPVEAAASAVSPQGAKPELCLVLP